MKSVCLIFLIAFTCLFANSAYAQSISNDDFILNFEGICLRNVHEPQLIKPFVEAIGATPLPKELHALALTASEKLSDTWLLEKDSYNIIIAVTQGKVNGKLISNCSFISKLADANLIPVRMGELYKMETLLDEKEGFQRYQTYGTIINRRKIIIQALTSLHKSTENIINLSAQYIH